MKIAVKRPALLSASLFVLSSVLISMELYLFVFIICALYFVHIILSAICKNKRGVFLSGVCVFLVIYPLIFTVITDSLSEIERKRTDIMYSRISADIINVDPRDDGAVLTVYVNGAPPGIKTAVIIKSKILPKRFGKIVFDGRIIPADKSDELYYSKSTLRAHGIGFVCVPDSYSVISPERTEQNNFIHRICLGIDKKFQDAFPETLGADTLMYAKALVAGDRSLFSDETNDTFTRSGLMPYLCISGLHVMLACAVLQRLLILLGFRPGARAVVGCVFLMILIFITGCGGSVVRASLMSACFLIFRAMRTDADNLSVLSVSLIILMLINPYSILLTGVQMSYLATLGVILAQKLHTYAKRAFGRASPIIESLNSGFMAQGFVAPTLVEYFDGVFLLSMFSSIVASVIFTPLMLLLIVASVISFLPWDQILRLVAYPIRYFLVALEKCAEFFAEFDYFFALQHDSGIVYFVFLLLLVMHLYFAISSSNKAILRSAVALASIPTVIIAVFHIISLVF